jgi:hypothetical protein
MLDQVRGLIGGDDALQQWKQADTVSWHDAVPLGWMQSLLHRQGRG